MADSWWTQLYSFTGVYRLYSTGERGDLYLAQQDSQIVLKKDTVGLLYSEQDGNGEIGGSRIPPE